MNSGPSDDWAKGVANIKYTFTLEVAPGEDDEDSYYGFNLPENRVPLVGKEVYAGIKQYLRSFL